MAESSLALDVCGTMKLDVDLLKRARQVNGMISGSSEPGSSRCSLRRFIPAQECQTYLTKNLDKSLKCFTEVKLDSSEDFSGLECDLKKTLLLVKSVEGGRED